jgi:superfamily II DNA or RNA helicase
MPAAGPAPRGPQAQVARPRRHPFAAPVEQLAAALAAAGAGTSASLGLAVASGEPGEAFVWLPGAQASPQPSPQLIRDDDSASPWRPAEGTAAARLWPFKMPALRLGPGPALDAVLALADHQSAGVNPGDSIRVLSALAGLALEIVGGGRALPGVVTDAKGAYVARWSPIGGDNDEQRLRLLAAALPPVCRAGGAPARSRQPAPAVPTGADPVELARHVLGAFVDAVCRDALRQARRSALGPRRRGTGHHPPTLETWLAALAAEQAEVDADRGELAKLERLLTEWRAGLAGRGGPWRLCFRVREPDEATDAGEANTPVERARATEDAPWQLELLLQATDDPSLVVEAEEVWQSGAALRTATRTLEAPHEVLLAELGRARCAYPALSAALREPAPTGLELDLGGAHRFLSEVAPALEVAGFGVLLPSWWRHPSARLGARLRAHTKSGGGGGAGSGLLGGEALGAFEWRVALGDQELGEDELQELARLKAPLVRVRGKWVELRPGEAEKLAEFLRAGRGRRPGQGTTMSVAELLRAAAGVDDEIFGIPVTGVEADGLLGALLRGELEDHVEVKGTPAGFVGQLRPYQERGVAWMELLERTGLGACLADDMGLGKTAMVLALVLAERGRPGEQGRGDEPGPTLVVCPTSVVGNWKREAAKFAPELTVVVHHGTSRSRAGEFSQQLAGVDIVITSYSLVDRDRAVLAGVNWSRVVLDEAQNVKNPEAKQTKAVRALSSRRRLALTGTPVENHLGELWSIMEILNPGLLGSASAFRERFALPIERYHEQDAAERLRALTHPFVLRRLKTDRSIITDLPEKLEMKVLCNLTREQATLYQAVVDEMLRRVEEAEGMERRGLVLATMLRLKQVCNHPAQYLGDGSALSARSGKLERTVEILDEVLQGGERALVFTQFAEMGSLLRSHLQQRLGCQVAFLHGGLARKQRDILVERFQEEADVPIMVLSLKAGGTGLNLTAANHVVHFDRWWNPAVENQATDRAFRIGQHRNVQVRKLVCVGTLEDRIDQMIDAKRELAERVVGTGEAWLTELSTTELADVFRLSAEAVGA